MMVEINEIIIHATVLDQSESNIDCGIINNRLQVFTPTSMHGTIFIVFLAKFLVQIHGQTADTSLGISSVNFQHFDNKFGQKSHTNSCHFWHHHHIFTGRFAKFRHKKYL